MGSNNEKGRLSAGRREGDLALVSAVVVDNDLANQAVSALGQQVNDLVSRLTSHLLLLWKGQVLAQGWMTWETHGSLTQNVQRQSFIGRGNQEALGEGRSMDSSPWQCLRRERLYGRSSVCISRVLLSWA